MILGIFGKSFQLCKYSVRLGRTTTSTTPMTECCNQCRLQRHPSKKSKRLITIPLELAMFSSVMTAESICYQSSLTLTALVNENRNLRSCLFLSVAYSSNIGGTATQTGSVPQLYLKGILNE